MVYSPRREKSYEILDRQTEMPGPDTIVALDTEFVSLKQPELQMDSTGEKKTIRPMSHALARVSVVRGDDKEDMARAFIDDYIDVKDHVVDYLTKYSGVTAEDLDPVKSQHNVVSLKTTYKKLWVLLNLGCRFLGHGLKADFRVINVQVPKAQVIDTIELLYLPHKLRKLSLSFLAWYLLQTNIQLHTHDSIEDARTALKLYRKYCELKERGELEWRLEEMYRDGKSFNYKAPRAANQEIKRADTPPTGLVEGALSAPGLVTGTATAGAGGETGGTGTEAGTTSTAITPGPGPVTPLRRPAGIGIASASASASATSSAQRLRTVGGLDTPTPGTGFRFSGFSPSQGRVFQNG